MNEPSTTSPEAGNILVLDYISRLKETHDSCMRKIEDGCRTLHGIARESPSTFHEPDAFETRAREVRLLVAIVKRESLALYSESAALQEELSSALDRFTKYAKAILNRPLLLPDWVKDCSFGFWKDNEEGRFPASFDSWMRQHFDEIARYQETVSEVRQITSRLFSEIPVLFELVDEEAESLRTNPSKTLQVRGELVQSLHTVPISLEYLDRIYTGLGDFLARLKTEIELEDVDPLLRTSRPV